LLSTIRVLAVGLTLTGLATTGAVGMASPGQAAERDRQAAAGQLVLYAGPFAGSTETVRYTTCRPAGQHEPRLSLVTAFDNRPLPGCQAVLINLAGTTKALCAGRGLVPVEFRQASRIQIQPGTSPACPAGNGSRV
jgi:hypothetical protein